MLLAVAAAAFAGISCDPAENKVEEIFEVSPLTLSVNPEGETKTFSVKSNYSWTASADSWIKLSTTSEKGSTAAVTVAAEVSKNSEEAARTGQIVITLSTGTKQEITVTQENFSAPKGLYNAADFAELAAEIAKEESDFSKWTDDKTILIYQDLDLSSLDCFPVSQWPAGYTLDGQGHGITVSINSDANRVGIFTTVRGTVKNVNLYGMISATPKVNETYIGALAATSLGSLGSDDEAEYAVTLENVNNYCTIGINADDAASKSCVKAGGLIGTASTGLVLERCTNNGAISFKAKTGTGWHIMGGLVGVYGSASEAAVCTINSCANTGDIECLSDDSTSWNNVGGFVGRVLGAASENDLYIVKDGTVSGNITLGGSAKTRLGGFQSLHSANSLVSGCTYSGTITLNAATVERCAGGISGYGETSCNVKITGCVFSGKLLTTAGTEGAIYCGGITGSGYSAGSVIENCRTTKNSRVEMHQQNSAGKGNCSMIVSQSGQACSVKDCKVAGTIVTPDGETVISAENYADWMVTGWASASKAVASGCGYNNE